MFGALQGQHGAFPPSSWRKGDAGAYVKKSSLSLTILSLCAEARGLLSQTQLRLGVKTGGYGRILAHPVSYPNVFI